MLDNLPPELLMLVGEAACPRSEIANDVVIHGALLDASGRLVLCGRRKNVEARQILVHARAVCRFLHDQLPSPRLFYRNVVGPGADGLVAQNGTNTWIPEDVVFPQAADNTRTKVMFRYEVRVEGQGEAIGGLSCNRARFGAGGEDALTWYLAPPQRHRFGFRTRMFDVFPGAGPREEITLVPGQWHSVMMVIEKQTIQLRGEDFEGAIQLPGSRVNVVNVKYAVDGRRVSSHVLNWRGRISEESDMLEQTHDPVDRWGVPGQRFGMITYDTSYSWRNAQITYYQKVTTNVRGTLVTQH